MTARWKKRPDGSNWGEFGPDDQIGRLNYLTPQKVLEGIAEDAAKKTCVPTAHRETLREAAAKFAEALED